MALMPTLAVIPARAGSRRLPGKHLKQIGGVPMIVHTIRAALDAASIDRVVVSTNDAAVARTARRAGAEVPFRRPESLSADDTPTQPVIAHAVHWAEEAGFQVDLVVTLQATSPLRTADQIDAAVALVGGSVRSAVSVAELGMAGSVVGTVADGRFTPATATEAVPSSRAPISAAARLTGGVYVTRRDLLAEGRLVDDQPAALTVDPVTAIDVDSPADLAAARRAWRSRGRRP